ncbi:MAG: hypothetical protein ACL7AX_09915 [Candidatus Arsenophonus phytopathogenicus]
MASEGGNNGFAKSLGIHPSTASRDKTGCRFNPPTTSKNPLGVFQ